MASLSALTLKEAIIPLVSSFSPGDLRTTKVEWKWTAGNPPVNEYSKMYLPVCDDPLQKEVFC